MKQKIYIYNFFLISKNILRAVRRFESAPPPSDKEVDQKGKKIIIIRDRNKLTPFSETDLPTEQASLFPHITRGFSPS